MNPSQIRGGGSGFETFGERIRALRLAKGLQQKELAARANIEVTYLSKIETGRLPPPSETVIRSLAQALDADPDELCLLAAKVPSDLQTVILEAPKAPVLLRTARYLGDDEWDKLIAMAARLARRKKRT